ncbi:hypothetical protein LINGRAHAP2_LOCUS13357 [Linum grandiflorum]
MKLVNHTCLFGHLVVMGFTRLKMDIGNGFRVSITNMAFRLWAVSEIWNCVWSMQIPPQVKHFLWKFLRNILPTGDNMSHCNSRLGYLCPFCGLPESQIYFFS